MFGVAIGHKSGFLFFVLSRILYNSARCPADGLSCCACLNLLYSLSWKDLHKTYCKEDISNLVLCLVEPQNPYMIMKSLMCHDTMLALMKLQQKKFSCENWQLLQNQAGKKAECCRLNETVEWKTLVLEEQGTQKISITRIDRKCFRTRSLDPWSSGVLLKTCTLKESIWVNTSKKFEQLFSIV